MQIPGGSACVKAKLVRWQSCLCEFEADRASSRRDAYSPFVVAKSLGLEESVLGLWGAREG